MGARQDFVNTVRLALKELEMWNYDNPMRTIAEIQRALEDYESRLPQNQGKKS